MKNIHTAFTEKVKELTDLAGEDDLLRKRLQDWVNKNFRAHQINNRISFEERIRARMDVIMQHKTQAMMGQLSQSLVKSQDLQFINSLTEEKEIELRAMVIVFAAGVIEDEAVAPTVA